MWYVVAGCLAVSALTLLLPSAPTYDPWAWLLWGRQILDFDLVTTGGPSWKPLPMLFIVPFQLLGEDVAPYLWLWIARAGGLLACVMVFRLARRFTGGGILGAFAGVVAFAALFSSWKFVRDTALGNSEPLMAALALWAFERHLDGRRDHALYLAAGAALMRPEVWPFLGLYGLWLWFREPRLRLPMAGIAIAIPALWFLPEQWGSGDWFRAANRANDPRATSPAFADFPAWEILRRYGSTLVVPVFVSGLAGGAVAAVRYVRDLAPSERRRDWGTLVLAGGGAAWLALVAGMTQAGYAGNQRYLIIPTVAICVLAGLGAARVAQGAALLARRRRGERAGRVAAVATVAVALAASAPVIGSKLDNAETIVDALEYEALVWDDLDDAIDQAGGAERLLSCQRLYSGAFQTQLIAYELDIKGLDVTFAGTQPGSVPATAPGAVFQTRTSPNLGVVPPLSDESFRRVARNDRWTILTAPPEGSSSCPSPRTG
jgi:hypothetical protein